MQTNSDRFNQIFNRSIEDYHKKDHVDTPMENPFSSATLDHILYAKNWIDAVQWHLEDNIRLPDIEPV